MRGRDRALSNAGHRDQRGHDRSQFLAEYRPGHRLGVAAGLCHQCFLLTVPGQDRALRREHGLVFASAIGTPLDPIARREFRKITEVAGLGLDGRRGTCATPPSV